MSNLHTAKLAIEAEIAHAKQGLDYYAERVNSLEQALARIMQAEGGAAAVAPAPAKAAKPQAKAGKRKARTAKPGVAATGAEAEVAELPSTGGDYWKNLVGAEPKSGQAILAEAVNGLGFKPTKAQVGKLLNRMTFALNSMVKAGAIQDSGSGRERRFFKS
ncbi:MAG TPA: hypothetical protein VL051_08280 [Burkholderiaceae bacterium]|nr:hypothetical protein [Burkholderiaceae bacterium]